MAILQITPTPTPRYSSYQPNYSPNNFSFNPTPAPTPTPTVQGNALMSKGWGNTIQYNNSGVGGAYPLAQPRPATLGATTTAPAPSTGGVPQPQPQQQGPSPEDVFMQMLNKQFDQQNGNLREMEAGLGGQRSSMEQQANNTYQQGYNTATSQYNTSKGDIENYQAKTLQDIGDALKSMWQQGGRMLGSRGASDSSASNQYNYAISKLGSKQRGDVMQDVAARLTNLKGVYDTNIQNLELEKNNQMQQIAQWYGEASNQIRGMRGELQQQKSQEALNMAAQMINEVRSQAANRQSILDSWAAQKAQSLPELSKMLASNAAGMPGFTGLNANMTSGGTAQSNGLFGFGSQGQDSLSWLKNIMG